MSRIFAALALAVSALAFSACGDDTPDIPNGGNNGENNVPGTDTPATEETDLSMYENITKYPVRDLALIYQGARHRIDWTESEFEPYLTHSFMGSSKEEWLFDGFLFLEFTTGTDADGHHFCWNEYQPNAQREHYEWYLDRLFEKNKSLDALNKLIGKKKQKLGDPGFKHKVALTTFVPCKEQTDWGELDGKKMNFYLDDDRMAVITWFINQLVERFKAENYENLELYGIYMLCEDVYQIDQISQKIKVLCRRKGLDYLWIPYYNSWRMSEWRSFGFDQVYHQPNHFFTPTIPDERLDDAIEMSRKLDIALEFECDENAISQLGNTYRSRMISYVDYFEKHGVWYDTPIAYYTGHHLFLDFVKNPSPLNSILFDRVCRHIVNRRLAAERDSKTE